MRLACIDIESNSLDHKTGRIIEIGLSIWEWTPSPRPLIGYGILLNDNYTPLPPEIVELTGISDQMLIEFGQNPKSNFEWLSSAMEKHNITMLVGHNLKAFDLPFLLEEFKRHNVDFTPLSKISVIDTKIDIPFEKTPDSLKLKYLAHDHGFAPQPYSHRALADCMTTMAVLSKYDLEKVISYAKIPNIVVRAVVSFQDKDLAKAEKFQWEKVGDKTYPKCWVKQIKENKFEEEVSKCKFQVVKLT